MVLACQVHRASTPLTAANPCRGLYKRRRRPVVASRRLRTQYLGYRDSSIVEETACSDEEYEHERRVAQVAAQLTQRQVQKLTQCKSCLAAYPKAETFLTAALARESADPSLAYESWSVCSYCYAIYERDQQLQKVETKFADILGSPDVKVKLAGLGKLDDQADVIDPHAASTVLPAQLTLCRLLLVINGIYDIPPELYDAENDSAHASGYPARSRRTLEAISSHLYLRISALGYTECIPVDPTEICISHERAPRGARRRRSSALSSADGDDSEEDDAGGGRLPSSPNHQQQPRTRNYWLPIHLIRAVHFFAPRTPLHAKLKETSGLTPFLNEENSISIQFIRATEPPLQDPLPIPTELAERARTRRTALQPPPLGSTVAFKAELPKKTCASSAANHSVLLGATKLRMAQFRSAYVTKLDFYACMALTGEMFNIKGNLGLERIRYVDTKFLTSRYKLRAYNGVYIPDASYVPSDPLTSEWMDCLRVAAISVPSPTTSTRVGKASASARHQTSRDDAQSSITLNRGQRLRQAASTTSLSTANEDMDEELEYMIEHAGRDPPGEISTKPRMTTSDRSISPISPVSGKSSETDTAATKKDIPSEKPISSIDAQMKMLMTKPVLSPGVNTYELSLPLPLSSNQKPALWSLVVQLNHVHNLQSREQPYCRWECHYELFGQRRSAIERSSTARSPSPQNPELSTDFATEDPVPAKTEVLFTCTHRFFLTATKSRIASHLRSNPIVTLNLRNDVYSSTRSRSAGEFFCRLDLSSLMSCRSYDATLDVHASSNAPQLTPRESALVSRYPPYLSVSVQLSELLLDPDEVVSTGEFVVVGVTKDGVNVLKKIASVIVVDLLCSNVCRRRCGLVIDRRHGV